MKKTLFISPPLLLLASCSTLEPTPVRVYEFPGKAVAYLYQNHLVYKAFVPFRFCREERDLIFVGDNVYPGKDKVVKVSEEKVLRVYECPGDWFNGEK